MLNQGYDVYFVINDNEYRNNLERQYGKHFIETNSFKGKIFALRSKLWFVSAFEMPVGGFLLKWGRTIVHLTHGSLIKNVGEMEKDVTFIKKVYYKLCVKTNLTYSIATSKFFVPSTSAYTGVPCNKILISGFPRNDALFTNSKEKPKILRDCGFSVLYAPTWRKQEKTKLFPFDDVDYIDLNNFLEKNDITVFIRLHPNDEKTINQEMLHSRIHLFSSSEYEEIMDYLNYFDSLITDYSSIAYDFLLLDRPITYLPYDYEEYEHVVGFAVNYDQITPGYKPKSLSEFKEGLLDMKTQDSFKEKRQSVCCLCNEYKTGSSERLLKMLKELGVKQIF